MQENVWRSLASDVVLPLMAKVDSDSYTLAQLEKEYEKLSKSCMHAIQDAERAVGRWSKKVRKSPSDADAEGHLARFQEALITRKAELDSMRSSTLRKLLSEERRRLSTVLASLLHNLEIQLVTWNQACSTGQITAEACQLISDMHVSPAERRHTKQRGVSYAPPLTMETGRRSRRASDAPVLQENQRNSLLKRLSGVPPAWQLPRSSSLQSMESTSPTSTLNDGRAALPPNHYFAKYAFKGTDETQMSFNAVCLDRVHGAGVIRLLASCMHICLSCLLVVANVVGIFKPFRVILLKLRAPRRTTGCTGAT